ncbi:MAG: hypothetical protein K2N51_13520 [Lachnospiraceae bacterium]|nr:hypothetical protein [Lachnospiraceae bacterium]
MKQLYWIDDNFQQVNYIAQGAISKLWKLEDIDKEEIASKILIFGNAYKVADTDELPTEENEREVYQKLQDLFMEECQKHDGPSKDRPMYNEKKVLIQDPISYLYKREVSGDLEAYKKMKGAWISENLDDKNSENYEKAAREAGLLIERMKIKPASVVGIDIALLHDDLERLRQKRRILSMELCHQILSAHIRCFMYSTEADDDILRKNWEEMYGSFYDNEEIKIYKRSDLMQKGNDDIVKEIDQMFEKEQKDEVQDNGKDNVG